MPLFNMTVTGLNEQIARFTNMEGAFQSSQIAEIINYALQQVVDLAYAAAPVRTGALRKSINHIMLSDYSGEAFVGIEYGHAQEDGYITPQGARIPGKHYFAPAANTGRKTLLTELQKYITANAAGKKVAPPHAQKGGGSLGRAHKYLRKEVTGAGVRYIYGPKRTTTTTRHFVGKPGGKKQPTTKFQRRKPGKRR
jgi:hypothetical protein